MKTYTKKTEEQYLEYLNRDTQVLKQEYSAKIFVELREQGLICECVRGETKGVSSGWYSSSKYTEYLYNGEVAMKVYDDSTYPSIYLQGKILLVEGVLYCNVNGMNTLLEIELSFGRLIIGNLSYSKQMNYYNSMISGLLTQPETYQCQRHFNHVSTQAKRLHQSQILSINHSLM